MITKQQIYNIINDIKNEDIDINAKSPISLSHNKNIFKKYHKLYGDLFKNSEIIYIFKTNDIDELLNNMFCYCGNKKQFTTRFDKPYMKYCSHNCCKKSKEYQNNRYKSWKITWESHTDEEKREIHKRQQENRKMTQDSINRMVEHRKETISNWTEEFKNELSQKFSNSMKNTWKNRTEEEKKGIGQKISLVLNKKCNNGLTVAQNSRIKGSNTYKEKTGYDNQFKNPKIKKVILHKNKLNVKERMCEARKTMNERFGGWYSSTKQHKEMWNNKNFKNEYLQKQYESKRKNNSFNTSKPEDRCYELLKSKFNDVTRNYSTDSRYPFNCDFYIPSKDLFIECHFHWTHGGTPFNGDNQEHLKQLEKWRSSNSKYCNIAINVWTKRDPLKLKTFIDNKLNYKIFYKEEEFVKWFEIL